MLYGFCTFSLFLLRYCFSIYVGWFQRWNLGSWLYAFFLVQCIMITKYFSNFTVLFSISVIMTKYFSFYMCYSASTFHSQTEIFLLKLAFKLYALWFLYIFSFSASMQLLYLCRLISGMKSWFMTEPWRRFSFFYSAL